MEEEKVSIVLDQLLSIGLLCCQIYSPEQKIYPNQFFACGTRRHQE
jgi:hypothetical protein